jgi:hypothetical protein
MILPGRRRSWACVDGEALLTYRGVIMVHLRRLADITRIPAATAARQLDALGLVLGKWSDVPVKDFDGHHSFTANDGSPVEFSFAVSNSEAAARVLFEPLDGAARPFTAWREGRAFARRLERLGGVSAERFRRVEDLFVGTAVAEPFSVLYSAELTAHTEDPLFKMYLNPSLGDSVPETVVGAAMARLGMREAWAGLDRHLLRGSGGRQSPEIALFALDLSDSPAARVKVYLRQAGRGAEEIDQAVALAGDHRPGWFTEILHQHYPEGVTGLRKSPMICLIFTGNAAGPSSATLYCPLDPNLANDAEADARVTGALEMAGIDPGIHRAGIGTICGPEPGDSNRLSWVSFKYPDDPVVTLYAGLDGSPQRLGTAR